MLDNERRPESANNDVSYGGFRYHWSYDEYRRSLIKKRKRAENGSKLRFAITMSVIFFLCMMILLFVLLYSQYAGENTGVQDAGAELPTLGIYAEGISEDAAARFGLERGVLVKYTDAFAGGSALLMGDIVLTVNGAAVTTARQLADALGESGDATVRLWRGGEVLELVLAE